MAEKKRQEKKKLKIKKKVDPNALPPEPKPKDINTNKLMKVENTPWLDSEGEWRIKLWGIDKRIPKFRFRLPRVTFKSLDEEINELPMEEIKEIVGSNIEGLRPNEIEQPMLLLMRTNGDIDTFPGVPDGLFKMVKDKKIGSEKESETKGILLSNNKLHNWKYAGENVKVWVAYEDEATPYPVNVQHDSSMLVKFYEKILLNSKLLNTDDKMIPGWVEKALFVVAGLAILLYIMYKLGILDAFTAKQTLQVATTSAGAGKNVAKELVQQNVVPIR